MNNIVMASQGMIDTQENNTTHTLPVINAYVRLYIPTKFSYIVKKKNRLLKTVATTYTTIISIPDYHVDDSLHQNDCTRLHDCAKPFIVCDSGSSMFLPMMPYALFCHRAKKKRKTSTSFIRMYLREFESLYFLTFDRIIPSGITESSTM